MDKQRICRELALILEPWPNENTVIWSMRYSPLKFWDRDAKADWRPFNPFDSEDDSARLLEVMPQMAVVNYGPVGWHVFKCTEWFCGAQGEFWGIRSGAPIESIVYGNHKDRRTAIVLAACKWKGVKVG